MQSLTLIDTSCWIEALRISGNIKVREIVKGLLVEGRAAWCDMVLLELWNGAQGNSERKMLNDLAEEITMLPISNEVWSLARKLARKCRDGGKTVPSTDILIVSCGLGNKAKIEHQDKHFDIILEMYSK
ncbi:MAG: PIN domain-containing protein [Proteobacteria bacterium]|nr:PIN domain-containing protein [Pseudomonadota bacterium]